jgi:hypothetical protein
MPKSEKIRGSIIYFFDNPEHIPFHNHIPEASFFVKHHCTQCAADISATSGSRDCILYEHLAPKHFFFFWVMFEAKSNIYFTCP